MKRPSWPAHAAWIIATLVIALGDGVSAQHAPNGKKPSSADSPSAARSAQLHTASAAQPTETPPATSRTKPASAKAKKFHGRLPAHYAKVVDDRQRREIYAIQEQYYEKIAALKAQLEATTNERDDKIAAVLTDQQREKVASLKAAGRQYEEKQSEK